MHHIGFRYRRFNLLHASSLLYDVVHASYVYQTLDFAIFSRLVLHMIPKLLSRFLYNKIHIV
jgi:hypothetical protein